MYNAWKTPKERTKEDTDGFLMKKNKTKWTTLKLARHRLKRHQTG